ncbi:MAG: DNA polymerase III subunit delta [Gammaproteobacteria bacterium]|nr:DNA polymerase III subunit delta [Gammaproteobacteria bacterium]
MRLHPPQIEGHLRRGLAPAYLLCGDEPLQLTEAFDAITTAARETGFQERVVLDADSRFDWGVLTAELGSLSLFATRRVIDLRLPGGKPGREGGAVLREVLETLSPDTLLLVNTGKLDGGAYKSAWFKGLEQKGVVVQSQAIDIAQLPRWIARRAAARGMTLDDEAAAIIAERTEGNLLACDQELEKLLLVEGPGTLDPRQVLAAVSDSARHDFYQLADEALAGNAGRIARIVPHLEGEGTPLPLVLWALGQDIRGLCTLAHGGGATQRPPPGLVGGAFQWKRRRALFEAALARHPMARLLDLLAQFALLDRAAKGRGAGVTPWVALERYCLALAGQPGFLPRQDR